MTTFAPLEVLLRETLDRLERQEQRTAVLEAAILDPDTPHSLTQTTTGRSADTTVSPRPKREASAERPPRVPTPDTSAVAPSVVMSSLDDVIWSVSPDGQLVFFAGGAVERLYGLTAHELHDTRGLWLDALPREDRERLLAALARLPNAGTFSLEHSIDRASGGTRWVVTRGKLVRDPDGRPVRIDGITTDGTRKARTRDAILAVLNGIGSATGSDFLTKLTQHLCDACGARVAVVVESHPHSAGEARTVALWVDGRGGQAFAFPATGGLVRELLAGSSAFVPASARDRHPSDPLLLKLRAEGFAAEPLVDDRGRFLGFVAVADDRGFETETEVRTVLKALAPRAAVELSRANELIAACELEARLAAAEQRAASAERALRANANLAAVGRLAAGVAHDFHNMLGVIVGNADLLREATPTDDPRRETAETIARTAYTVAAVSRQMLAIGRPGEPKFGPLDIAVALRAMEPMLRQLTGRKTPLEFDLASELPLVCADATQFDRMILNLVLNARDASPIGGTITVRATTTKVEPDRANWPTDRPVGEYVAITVVDHGCGMTAEVREKMFDVFFTTKGERGTGLGLVTVSEAVRAANGHIEVESEPGWGTTVRVFWPPLAELPRPRLLTQGQERFERI